ncbi:MAG: hypothetical protein ACE5LB_03155 [Acidiferrobacterales bacterium]
MATSHKATTAAVFLTLTCAPAGAVQVDEREFNRAVHSFLPKKVSFFFTLTEDTLKPVAVWPGLWLRVRELKHVKVRRGAFAYSFQFASDHEFRTLLNPQNQPGHGITADVVAAFHFRNSDNSGPNQIGPKNVNAPQEVRHLLYEGFASEIRVVRFQIIGAEPGQVPAFAFLECLVIVAEKP